MTGQVLFVDDEPHVLEGYKRALRKRVSIDTATAGGEALERLASNGGYPVLITDMRMPKMSGLELLVEVRKRYPDMVRVMLTGNADQQTAVDAVNRGDIFRFLTKPCRPETLARTIAAALRQHQLLTAEKMLLENTLTGAVRALTEALALVNPEAFSRTERLKEQVVAVGKELRCAQPWQIESLALLSQVGCIMLPDGVLKKVTYGEALTEEEHQLFVMHPCVGADLLAGIPRMEEIVAGIRYQEKCFDGSGTPLDPLVGEEIPLGGRILKAVLDHDKNLSLGLSARESLTQMHADAHRYDPKVLAALGRLFQDDDTPEEKPVSHLDLSELTDEMTVTEDIRTVQGVLVVRKGAKSDRTVRERLRCFQENGQLQGKLPVWVG